MVWLILLLLSWHSLTTQECCVTIMGRSTFYVSPSKIRRNQSRLLSYLKHLLNKKKSKINLSISNQSAVSFHPIRKLTKSSIWLSNYPEPCTTCNKAECYFDVKHLFAIYKSDFKTTLSEAIQSAVYEATQSAASEAAQSDVNEVLSKQPLKKPPDVS